MKFGIRDLNVILNIYVRQGDTGNAVALLTPTMSRWWSIINRLLKILRNVIVC